MAGQPDSVRPAGGSLVAVRSRHAVGLGPSRVQQLRRSGWAIRPAAALADAHVTRFGVEVGAEVGGDPVRGRDNWRARRVRCPSEAASLRVRLQYWSTSTPPTPQITAGRVGRTTRAPHTNA